MLDAFHVVKRGTATLDEVRRRVQQETLGHRGRKGESLYGIQNVLRCGTERLTNKRRHDWARPSTPTTGTRRSTSPGSAPSSSGRPLRLPTSATARRSPRRSWRRSRPARSRRSSGSARPSSAGARRSLPTSTPAGRATVEPKQSTPSSSSTAVSPATATATGYGCCSSAAGSTTPTSSKKSPQNQRTRLPRSSSARDLFLDEFDDGRAVPADKQLAQLTEHVRPPAKSRPKLRHFCRRSRLRSTHHAGRKQRPGGYI